MSCSKRISQLKKSQTIAVMEKARELKAEGLNVISFSAGEPDFDTPDYIKQSAIKAIRDGFTKYTATAGIPELKKAICMKLETENNVLYNPNEVIVSCGAKHSIFNTVHVLADEEDEIIVISPYWVSYPEIIKSAGAIPKFVSPSKENEYEPTVEEIRKQITSKTIAIIINSPNNPTGGVYSKETLEGIAKIAVENDLYVIADDIYEKLIYENIEHICIASLNEEIKKRTIVINGLSKAYSMTGWRIGYAAADAEIIEKMSILQGHTTTNASSISQIAAVTALSDSKSFENSFREMLDAFNERRKYVMSVLDRIDDISYVYPNGAFYVFFNVSKYYGRKYNNRIINNSMDYGMALLENEGVAMVPGVGFGDDNFVRLSYATSYEDVKAGMERFERFCNSIQ